MKPLLLVFAISACSFAFAFKPAHTFPPDSTASIADRSAAMISIDQGKKSLNEGKVRDALLHFRDAVVKDPYNWKGNYWVAYCHLQLNNFGYARQYGTKALELGKNEVDNDLYDILGTACHHLNSLDTALMYYDIAIRTMSAGAQKDRRTAMKRAECLYAKSLAGMPNIRVNMRGDVNSGFNDYAPLLSKNGTEMYFTSRRGNTTGGKTNPDDQEFFEDIYHAVWNQSTQMWDSVTNDLSRLNSKGFDAMSYVSADGNHALITINNTATDAKNMTRSSDIAEVEYTTKSRWNAPKLIQNKSINSTFYDGAATMTADRNTMYFVSDRKGEKRSSDIYVVQRNGKTWGAAEPVSDSINTEYRETTPWISPDGRFLFFSSNGHKGMGGMDVYVCENLGSGWGSAINLGPMVNTVNDDTHFVVYKELNKAVMAGFNVEGQKSSMDVYEIDLSKLKLPVKW